MPRTKTKVILDCSGQTLFRTVEKTWKNKQFGQSNPSKKIQNRTYFAHFPNLGTWLWPIVYNTYTRCLVQCIQFERKLFLYIHWWLQCVFNILILSTLMSEWRIRTALHDDLNIDQLPTIIYFRDDWIVRKVQKPNHEKNNSIRWAMGRTWINQLCASYLILICLTIKFLGCGQWDRGWQRWHLLLQWNQVLFWFFVNKRLLVIAKAVQC